MALKKKCFVNSILNNSLITHAHEHTAGEESLTKKLENDQLTKDNNIA